MMKKRLIITSVVGGLLIAAALLLLDLHCYHPQSKTVNCDTQGLILSITTFDGAAESTPFVKCFGHTWLSIDNQTDHSVYLNAQELKPNEQLTFSIWAISDHCGVVYNLEAAYIADFDRYGGRRSLGANIDETQLQTVETYIAQNDNWTLGKNCSRWCIGLWNTLLGDTYPLTTQNLLYSPKRVQSAMNEYDCVEADKDFSRANGIFFYRDGVRTELTLCEERN